MNARGRGCLPDLFGFRVMALEQGLLVAEFDIRPELLAPNGFLHAATVIALADTACGYGCIAHMPKGAENFTTVELKSNFLGTAREGANRVHREARAPRPEHPGVGRDRHAARRRQADRALPLHADDPLAEGSADAHRAADRSRGAHLSRHCGDDPLLHRSAGHARSHVRQRAQGARLRPAEDQSARGGPGRARGRRQRGSRRRPSDTGFRRPLPDRRRANRRGERASRRVRHPGGGGPRAPAPARSGRSNRSTFAIRTAI